MSKKFEKVEVNKYGYYELKKIPSVEERKEVFENEYFQNSMSSYEQEYSDDEKKYFRNKLVQKEWMIRQQLPADKKQYSFLDIGCGEGFALAYFFEQGYDVTGIDFSIYGVKNHNPQMEQFVIQGDSEEILPQLAQEGKKYDVVNLDSVLDMMVHPTTVLEYIREVMEPDGTLLIKVANNYSLLQLKLLEEGRLKKEYWLDEEGHPSYFNRLGLIALLDDYGYECVDSYGESFIDFNLLNPNTNYYETAGVGKSCYLSKIELENIMMDISLEKTMEVFKNLGEMGLGRELIALFKRR